MNVLYLNRSDVEGGAARAALSLLEGMRRRGVAAQLSVQRKSGDAPLVVGPPPLAGRAIGSGRRILESILSGQGMDPKGGLFSPAFLPDRLPSRIRKAAPDLVHLHWVARMMRLETPGGLGIPLVWTLHDSWAFTGGCFLPGDCVRYREACGRCPVLGSSREEDLSRRVWRRKQAAWRGADLTLIAPSRWMKERAEASSLFRGRRVEWIPNGIDTAVFTPADKMAAREALGLPQRKKLVLFGAKAAIRDRNKGFDLLVRSLRSLAEQGDCEELELVVFGASPGDPPPEVGIRTHLLGWQGDDAALARLYAAADLFVLPSLQENLPYAVMEAMACGTPCVAFRQGGVPDLIDHLENGYLAQPKDPVDLGRGILQILADPERAGEMGARARLKVRSCFELDTVVERHLALYCELLQRRKPGGSGGEA